MNNTMISTFGKPIELFEPNYRPSNINFHQAIKEGMGDDWKPAAIDEYYKAIENHFGTSPTLLKEIEKYGLTRDEAGAIVYYTSDARVVLNPLVPNIKSPYFKLNKLMATRAIELLSRWKPFLYYLISGLLKLPDYVGTVYRAINNSVLSLQNTQYVQDGKIVWVSFSSTCKSELQLKNFSEADTGSWLILDIKQGKDISNFSLFSEEQEVLLLPNTTFRVKTIIGESVKKVLGVPNIKIDVCQLEQIPTTYTYNISDPDQF